MRNKDVYFGCYQCLLNKKKSYFHKQDFTKILTLKTFNMTAQI